MKNLLPPPAPRKHAHLIVTTLMLISANQVFAQSADTTRVQPPAAPDTTAKADTVVKSDSLLAKTARPDSVKPDSAKTIKVDSLTEAITKPDTSNSAAKDSVELSPLNQFINATQTPSGLPPESPRKKIPLRAFGHLAAGTATGITALSVNQKLANHLENAVKRYAALQKELNEARAQHLEAIKRVGLPLGEAADGAPTALNLTPSSASAVVAQTEAQILENIARGEQILKDIGTIKESSARIRQNITSHLEGSGEVRAVKPSTKVTNQLTALGELEVSTNQKLEALRKRLSAIQADARNSQALLEKARGLMTQNQEEIKTLDEKISRIEKQIANLKQGKSPSQVAKMEAYAKKLADGEKVMLQVARSKLVGLVRFVSVAGLVLLAVDQFGTMVLVIKDEASTSSFPPGQTAVWVWKKIPQEQLKRVMQNLKTL
jgi:hypothetical protein